MTALNVLVNSNAGLSPLAAERRLARVLADHGVTAVIEAVEPERLAERVRAIAGAGAARLGVAGGDGTQRTAARALIGSDTALLPLPTGTLNHFARRNGLDSIDAAAAAVGGGAIRTVPVGRAGDQIFLNTAVAGVYPLAIRERERLRPWMTKWPAAVAASWIVFFRWPSIDATIRAPEFETRSRTAMIWAGLGRGSFPAVHESPPPGDDGVLEVVVLPGTGRRAAFALARAAFREWRGRAAPSWSMEVIRSPWVELRARHRVPIALDGEPVWMDPPVCLQVEPGALRVVVAENVDGPRSTSV